MKLSFRNIDITPRDWTEEGYYKLVVSDTPFKESVCSGLINIPGVDAAFFSPGVTGSPYKLLLKICNNGYFDFDEVLMECLNHLRNERPTVKTSQIADKQVAIASMNKQASIKE